MREIKFRAWDGFTWVQNVLILLDGEARVMNQIDEMSFGTDMLKRVILMQYTGLKDKNGKEIYEGDVVTNNDYTWEITWKEGCVYLQNTKDHGEWWIGTEHEHCEVIGNVWENPELSKDTKD